MEDGGYSWASGAGGEVSDFIQLVVYHSFCD